MEDVQEYRHYFIVGSMEFGLGFVCVNQKKAFLRKKWRKNPWRQDSDMFGSKVPYCGWLV